MNELREHFKHYSWNPGYSQQQFVHSLHSRPTSIGRTDSAQLYQYGHVSVLTRDTNKGMHRVVEWRTCVARSRVRLSHAATVRQRQLSVPSLRGRLMTTSDSWGVNGHTTRRISMVIRSLFLAEGQWNGDQRHPTRLWKRSVLSSLRRMIDAPLALITRQDSKHNESRGR